MAGGGWCSGRSSGGGSGIAAPYPSASQSLICAESVIFDDNLIMLRGTVRARAKIRAVFPSLSSMYCISGVWKSWVVILLFERSHTVDGRMETGFRLILDLVTRGRSVIQKGKSK